MRYATGTILVLAAGLSWPGAAATYAQGDGSVRTAPRAEASSADGIDPWAGAPVMLTADPFVVMISTPRTRRWLAAHDDAITATALCRAQFADTSIAQPPPTPWTALDDFRVPDTPVVAITLATQIDNGRPCGPQGQRGPGMVARGLAYVEHYAYRREYDVETASITRNDSALAPLRVIRLPIRLVLTRRAPAPADTAAQLRLYLAPDAFRPDPQGRYPVVQVSVTGVGAPPVTLTLPREVVERVWLDFLAARLATWRLAESPPTIAPPPAMDSVVRDATARYRAGDARAAAITLAERLSGPPLTDDDELQARAVLALSTLEMGDTLDGRAAARSVVEQEPCFSLAESQPPDWRAMFAAARPSGVRCEYSVGGIAASGLLLPGLGQARAGRRRAAVAIGGVAALSFAFALGEKLLSNSEYSKYRKADSPVTAQRDYEDANRANSNARYGAIAGGLVWAFGILEAGLHEARHAHHVRTVEHFGATPFAASQPRGAVVGLALTF